MSQAMVLKCNNLAFITDAALLHSLSENLILIDNLIPPHLRYLHELLQKVHKLHNEPNPNNIIFYIEKGYHSQITKLSNCK